VGIYTLGGYKGIKVYWEYEGFGKWGRDLGFKVCILKT